jgi:hypothetical protein
MRVFAAVFAAAALMAVAAFRPDLPCRIARATGGEAAGLRADGKLQKRITQNLKQPTVQDVVHLLQTQTGLPLSVKNVAKDKQAFGNLSLRNVPTWSLMDQLAKSPAVNGHWEKTDKGYVLVDTAAETPATRQETAQSAPAAADEEAASTNSSWLVWAGAAVLALLLGAAALAYVRYRPKAPKPRPAAAKKGKHVHLLLLLGLLAPTALVGGKLWSVPEATREGTSAGPVACRILYTSDTRGFLQACGCAAGQVGELAKRATLLKRLRGDGTSALLLDGGNLAADVKRAEVVMRYLHLLRYQVVGVGALDFQFGHDFVRAARAHSLPLVAANPPRGLEKTINSFAVVQTGGPKIGLVSIVQGPAREMVSALQANLERLKTQADLLVVLGEVDPATADEVALHLEPPALMDLWIGARPPGASLMRDARGVYWFSENRNFAFERLATV